MPGFGILEAVLLVLAGGLVTMVLWADRTAQRTPVNRALSTTDRSGMEG